MPQHGLGRIDVRKNGETQRFVFQNAAKEKTFTNIFINIMDIFENQKKTIQGPYPNVRLHNELQSFMRDSTLVDSKSKKAIYIHTIHIHLDI